MATPMVAEMASKWVVDGTAMELVRWQRAALASRHGIVADVLSGVDYRSHHNSLHIWLPLPGDRTEESFVSQARLQGVAIAPGLSFRTSDMRWQPAVRVSLGSTNESELRSGLGIVAKLLLGDPEHLLLAI
jgi:DNA-binding transcriptional MocR family regulator